MSFKFTESERSKLESIIAPKIVAEGHIVSKEEQIDRIESIISERGDGWVDIAEASPDPIEEPFLASDGQNIYTAFLTDRGIFIEQYTRALIRPTKWKLIPPPKQVK